MSSPAPTSCDVVLSGLAHGGEAVGRLGDGRVVFVPGGAPGDRVRVAIVEQRRDYARAGLLQVLQPGAARVEPPCALAAGACGGCPWMHVERPAQLAAKEDLVRRALRALPSVMVRPILAPTPALGYRVRARLLRRQGRLGFSAARSHAVAQTAECLVLELALARALFAAPRGVVAALRGPLGEEGSVSAVSGAGRVHVAVQLGAGGDRGAARAALRRLIDEGVIVGAVIDDRGASASDDEAGAAAERLGADVVDVGGADGEPALPLWVAADGFAQASAAGHGLVPRLVADAVGRPPGGGRWPRLLELHAGSGNLTRRLRPLCDELVAVEAEPAALARLRALVGGAGVVTYAEPAVRRLERLVRDGERFPVVVLDPPRGGAAAEVALLPRLAAERVVYLSCEPMTLARDLRALQAAGYAARWAQPIDLMPHTAHVEVLALLERAGPVV